MKPITSIEIRKWLEIIGAGKEWDYLSTLKEYGIFVDARAIIKLRPTWVKAVLKREFDYKPAKCFRTPFNWAAKQYDLSSDSLEPVSHSDDREIPLGDINFLAVGAAKKVRAIKLGRREYNLGYISLAEMQNPDMIWTQHRTNKALPLFGWVGDELVAVVMFLEIAE